MAITQTKLFLFSLIVSSTILTTKSELLSSKREKLTRFRLHVQNIIAGSNATVATVAQASMTNQSATLFGQVAVVDDVVTVDPETSSKNMGRVQGLVAFTSQSEMVLSMSMTFVFTEGKYNGSDLTVMGRNLLSLKVREMPIIGGTGLFRLARGYVRTSTYSSDLKKGLIVLVYDFYVYHY
ncbi:dirigent protein 19-like [Rhodamnia argentea]|uniref:Dirigent protein n=1 Tax=Rhodamnia argentea TaxID=178133 RepID=A0A8B8N4H3_9MYRT|nr:dirigent protein 19-like [Rhodamnia argentea]